MSDEADAPTEAVPGVDPASGKVDGVTNRKVSDIIESRTRRLSHCWIGAAVAVTIGWFSKSQAWWVNNVPGLTFGDQQLAPVSFTEKGNVFGTSNSVLLMVTIAAFITGFVIKTRIYIAAIGGLYACVNAWTTLDRHIMSRTGKFAPGAEYLTQGEGLQYLRYAIVLMGLTVVMSAAFSWSVAVAEYQVALKTSPGESRMQVLGLMFPQTAITRLLASNEKSRARKPAATPAKS